MIWYVICSHSREGKTLSYSQISMVPYTAIWWMLFFIHSHRWVTFDFLTLGTELSLLGKCIFCVHFQSDSHSFRNITVCMLLVLRISGRSETLRERVKLFFSPIHPKGRIYFQNWFSHLCQRLWVWSCYSGHHLVLFIYDGSSVIGWVYPSKIIAFTRL